MPTPASRRSTPPRLRRCPASLAVLTAETLKTVNLAWMPTLAGDVQMVLADGKVLFQNQEVAFVVADRPLGRRRRRRAGRGRLRGAAGQRRSAEGDGRRTRRSSARTSRTRPTAPTAAQALRTTSSTGRPATRPPTDAAFEKADVTIKEIHRLSARAIPCPLETCQCVASFDKIKGELTLWGTFQAPHVIRTVGSLISKIPEHKIHVIAPDIGGGFGNKVGAYSGYICAIVASIVTGRAGEMGRGPHREPVDHRLRPRLPHDDGDRRHQGRQGHRPARLHHRRPRRLRRLRQRDQVAGRALQHRLGLLRLPGRALSRSTASTPTRRRAASPIAARSASPKPPTASSAPWTSWRRSSAWIPAEFRMKNLIRREQFPYTSAFGWEYDSGDYQTALKKAMDTVGYAKLRAEQKAKQEAFKRGETRELMGIGVAFFTEIVGAGPSRACDILGIAMFDSAEIRIHPTGTGICRLGTKSTGPGARDHLRPDHRDRARPARRQHHRRGGQHRHRALRPRHLRLALDAGLRRRDRHGLPQDQGQGADDRRLHARSA